MYCRQLSKESKAAFTLAEVLITIGIIGIVAAMTIPALMSKCNEIATVNKLKKTYAELQQVIKLSEAENGDYTGWDYSLGTEEFVKIYILPYFNIQKIGKNLYSRNRQWYSPAGNGAMDGFWNTVPFYAYNDKLIIFHVSRTANSGVPGGYIQYLSIVVDFTTIPKKKNGKWVETKGLIGKNVFMFTLFNYTYGSYAWQTTSICPRGEHYGLYQGSISGYYGGYCATLAGVMGADSVRGDCKSSSTGWNCGLAIEKNNWKVPHNYPVKF